MNKTYVPTEGTQNLGC